MPRHLRLFLPGAIYHVYCRVESVPGETSQLCLLQHFPTPSSIMKWVPGPQFRSDPLQLRICGPGTYKESSLAEQAMAATPPDQLASLVDKISDLKTEATTVHLKCIHDTIEVLDDQQLAKLLELSDKE